MRVEPTRLMALGIDLDGYTMLETIEDNESVRRTFGYEHVNLLSESYGTRGAYLYALKHPEEIHRSAIRELLPYLKNGTQVIPSECGHLNDMWYTNRESMRLILSRLCRTGVPDTSMNSSVLMDFSVGWGFSRIAKAALGGVACPVLTLILLSVFFVRRRRRSAATRMRGDPPLSLSSSTTPDAALSVGCGPPSVTSSGEELSAVSASPVHGSSPCPGTSAETAFPGPFAGRKARSERGTKSRRSRVSSHP